MRTAGLVLAGGRSRRFGRNKALAELGARPLIYWSLDSLQRAADVVALSGPAELGAVVGLPSIMDAPGLPRGPLAGILGGLAWAQAMSCSHLLTVPCDTPFLPEDLGERLKTQSADRLVVAARADRVHALCALWRIDAIEPLRALAALEKQPALQAVVADLGGEFVQFPDEHAFANINRPEDMATAEAAHAAKGHPGSIIT